MKELDSATMIARDLGESDFASQQQIAEIVKALGEQVAFSLLERSLEIEDDGGLKVVDGSRRRTPGGIFFHLARQVLPREAKQRIFYGKGSGGGASRGEQQSARSAEAARPAQPRRRIVDVSSALRAPAPRKPPRFADQQREPRFPEPQLRESQLRESQLREPQLREPQQRELQLREPQQRGVPLPRGAAAPAPVPVPRAPSAPVANPLSEYETAQQRVRTAISSLSSAQQRALLTEFLSALGDAAPPKEKTVVLARPPAAAAASTPAKKKSTPPKVSAAPVKKKTASAPATKKKKSATTSVPASKKKLSTAAKGAAAAPKKKASPAVPVTKTSFVLGFPASTPAKDVVAVAASKGITLSLSQVYNIRSAGRKASD